MTRFFFIVLLFIFGNVTGQNKKNSLENPKNINTCIKGLNLIMDLEEKEYFRNLPEDSVLFCSLSENACNYIKNIVKDKSSKITGYFARKGIYESISMEEVILTLYHKSLNNKKLKTLKIIRTIRKKEFEEKDKIPPEYLKDTLYGVYIPKDIEDCCRQLDKMVGKIDKQNMKSLKTGSDMIAYHFGLGTWIRNNWGLWSGSRLLLYLNERGLYQPNSMSVKILELYYEWLHGNKEKVIEFHNK